MTLGSDIVVLDPPAPIGVAAPAVALPGEATSTPPPVILPAAGEPQASPDLSIVPAGVTVATAAPGGLRAISTAIASVALHGVLVAGFLAFAAPSPPRHDVPAIEIEMVEPEAEPPPAAAMPQEVAVTETPPVDIEPPPLADMPLPPELQPPAPVAEEPQPIALPPPPEPEARRCPTRCGRRLSPRPSNRRPWSSNRRLWSSNPRLWPSCPCRPS